MSWIIKADEGLALTEGELILLDAFKGVPTVVNALAVTRAVKQRTGMNLLQVAELLDSYQGMAQRTDRGFAVPNEAKASTEK